MPKRVWPIMFLCVLALACSSSNKSTNPGDGGGNEEPDPLIAPQLAGEVTFNGVNISSITQHPVTFWLRDESTYSEVDSAAVAYDPETGRYEMSSLPESQVGIFVSIVLNGPEETLADNYRGSAFVGIDTLSEAGAQDYNLRVLKIMHLTEPFDNSTLADLETYPAHSPFMTFGWEAVDGVDYYELEVMEYDDEPYAYVDELVSTVTRNLTYELTLPRNNDTHYQFSLRGYNGDSVKIAEYMTTYDGAYGWDYRFKAQ